MRRLLLTILFSVLAVTSAASAQVGNMITNGQFDQPLNQGWTTSGESGAVYIEEHLGVNMLRLGTPFGATPNAATTTPITFTPSTPTTQATYRLTFEYHAQGTWRAGFADQESYFLQTAGDGLPLSVIQFGGASSVQHGIATVEFVAIEAAEPFSTTLSFFNHTNPDSDWIAHIDYVQIECLTGCLPGPAPTFAPINPDRPGAQPTPGYTCGGSSNCGTVPLPLLPVLMSPTPLQTYTPQPSAPPPSATPDGTPPPTPGGPGSGDDGPIGDEQHIYGDLDGNIDGVVSDMEWTGGPVEDYVGAEIGVDGIQAFLDNDGIPHFFAYIKGLYGNNYFGPFQPVVNILLYAFPIWIFLTLMQFILPLAAIIIAFIRRVLDLIGQYVPFT